MADELTKPEATLAVISTQLNMMNQNIMENFKNIRDDIRRMEDSNKVSMEHLEARLNKRIDSTNKRIEVLEDGEKDTIATQAKHAVGYSLGGGVFASVILEMIKKIT